MTDEDTKKEEVNEYLQTEAEADAWKRAKKLNDAVTEAAAVMDSCKAAHDQAKGVHKNAVSVLNKFIRMGDEELPLFADVEYQKPIDAMLELTAEQMRVICWRYHNPADDAGYEVSLLPEEFQELKRSQIFKALEDRKEFILDELCYPQDATDTYRVGYERKPQTFEDAKVLKEDGTFDFEALFQFVANCIPDSFMDVLAYIRDDYQFVVKGKGKKKDQRFVDATVKRANCWEHPDKFNLVSVEAYCITDNASLQQLRLYIDLEDSKVKTLSGDIVADLEVTEQ